MSLILNIDTATETAHVSLSQNGNILNALHHASQKDHASFLQPAIRQLVSETGVPLKSVNALAVTAGPGSYTGLRVGMASAKGLCYALKKPLYLVNTLEVLTASVFYLQGEKNYHEASLLCPMIDARRMEVYTAIYDRQLNTLLSPVAMVLDGHSFEDTLEKNKILFFGSGSLKWQLACKHPNAFFKKVFLAPEALASLSYKAFQTKLPADLAYCEPIYLKEFRTVIK